MQIAWGRKVSPEFKLKAIAIADEIGFPVDYLMAAIAFETGESFSPAIRNPRSTATGLIQFMARTAEDLGTTTAALAAMSAEEQLEYVLKYFLPYKGRLKTLSDVYMAILLPKAIGLPEEAPLFKDDRGKVRDSYDVNAGLDANKDHIITKAEASAKVRRMLRKGLAMHLG